MGRALAQEEIALISSHAAGIVFPILQEVE